VLIGGKRCSHTTRRAEFQMGMPHWERH
jgi:hypothetical protein